MRYSCTAEGKAQGYKCSLECLLAYYAEDSMIKRNKAAEQTGAPEKTTELRIVGVEHKGPVTRFQAAVYVQYS